MFQDQSWTKEDNELSEKLMAVWAGSSYLPMSLANDPNFHRFLESLNPNVREECLHFNESLYRLISVHQAVNLEASEDL